MKQRILQIEKTQMELLLQKLSEENAEEIIKELELHLEIMRLASISKYEEQAVYMAESVSSAPAADSKDVMTSPMCRGLRGGFLGERKEIFVPENVIRSMRFDHGDIIKAERLISRAYQKHYKFSLVEKAHGEFDEPEPTCLYSQQVYYDDMKKHMFIQAKEAQQDTAVRVYLSEQDVDKFEIEEGDQVDYAFYQGDIFHGLVRWRHRV